ncbi:hypothetical protein SGRI78S_01685 [Streptomyces griseus subsp. griseus]
MTRGPDRSCPRHGAAARLPGLRHPRPRRGPAGDVIGAVLAPASDRAGRRVIAQKNTPHRSSTFAYGRASPVRTTRRAAAVRALSSSCGTASSQGK